MTRNNSLRMETLEAREVPATAVALGSFLGPNANNLFAFDTATPGTIAAQGPITGLAAGDVIVGIDFRPRTGELFGVGANLAADTVQVYTINTNTAVATAVGTPQNVADITGATAFGVDFNPAADRIRVVTDLASDGAGGNTNNFRLRPDTGALVAIDNDLDYTGLAGGAGDGPEVAVAYTNSGFTPIQPATTTLFGIVAGASALAKHATAPGFETLSTVGALGVALLTDAAGLDFVGSSAVGFALLNTAAGSQLFTVDSAIGAATLVGTIGNGVLNLSDVTIAPPAPPVAVTGSSDGKVSLFVSNTAGQVAAGPVVTVFASSTNVPRSTTADVDGDGIFDTIAVTGPGTPIRVTVISGADNTTALVAPFDPFGSNFSGGGFVTAADLDGDGKAEFVVTPDQGGGPRVSIFSRNADGSTTVRANFFGIDDANFRGGARAALGDVNNDGSLDLAVGAGFQGGPRVALFNGTTLFAATPVRLIGDFFAFPGTDATTLRNGVFLSIGDINGDGFGDMIFGGGPGGGPRVFILSGQLVSANNVAGAQAAPIANFFVANNQTDRGGIRVAAQDLDGDSRLDLTVGSGEGIAARVRAYLGANFTTANEPATFQDISVFGGGVLPGGVFVG